MPNVPAPNGRAATAVAFAKAQVGKGYRYATSGPDTFDCSGLTAAAWAAAGVGLAHYSGAQYQQTIRIGPGDLQPGDLVFYGPGGSNHVEIYIGGGMVVSASNPATGVKVAGVRYGSASGYDGSHAAQSNSDDLRSGFFYRIGHYLRRGELARPDKESRFKFSASDNQFIHHLTSRYEPHKFNRLSPTQRSVGKFFPLDNFAVNFRDHRRRLDVQLFEQFRDRRRKLTAENSFSTPFILSLSILHSLIPPQSRLPDDRQRYRHAQP